MLQSCTHAARTGVALERSPWIAAAAGAMENATSIWVPCLTPAKGFGSVETVVCEAGMLSCLVHVNAAAQHVVIPPAWLREGVSLQQGRSASQQIAYARLMCMNAAIISMLQRIKHFIDVRLPPEFATCP